MDRLDEVLADLAAEGDRLDALVAAIDDDGWRTSTPAQGWDVATQIAHLAWTDDVAILAATDKDAWDSVAEAALRDPFGFVDANAHKGAASTPSELLAHWRDVRTRLGKTLRNHPAGEKLPWFGPPMSPTSMATARFMETWAHSLDVHEALGVEPERSDRVRHVLFLGVITRKFAFAANDLPVPDAEVRVELTLPSGELWCHGPKDTPESVRGSAYDFALRVTQRRHRDDLDLVSSGPGADAWLDIAQAFAGPPGSGRPPS